MTSATQTKTDGAAAARFAAGVLGIATCAETSATTMTEDAAKVDVKFSFRHVVVPKKLITAHAQIKAGPSYRKESSNEYFITLGIDKDTINALSGTGMPGLVIWVPPPPMDRLYWYATDPRSLLKTPAKIRRSQYLRPSIRYDLCRLYDYASWSRRHARQTVAAIPDDQVMRKAKEAYGVLKRQIWANPLVGELKVTRLAWRHITRRSKSITRRMASLRIVPYLKAFLATPPDRYACNFAGVAEFGSRTIETRYLMCWYRQALSINGDSYSLLVRIREEISYPTRWQSRPLSTGDIQQVATLVSWWGKKDE
ncbi:hypothetical protein [Paraburkholderia solisilvae]|uniref:DUF4365 domain-containing protein n=1 Tax=Paraburkholderia solisilvae TaxID=624376 RepID=A0A6J5ETV1_9BURK|nr:hypothetical protein [Paraburkholderia solisilvae]CAB3768582.1 hypothetical protein LMG29739_05336 [Paraburkholderia solisilvae]